MRQEPLPRYLLPTLVMKKAIEKNAKEDETLTFTLEKLDNDRQLALCQVWGKKEAFIRGTAKKNYRSRFRRKISVDDLGMMNEHIPTCAASGEMCSASRKTKNNQTEVGETSLELSGKISLKSGRKSSRASYIDKLPSLNDNHHSAKCGPEIHKSRRISFAAFETPRDPSIRSRFKRRATMHQL